MSDADWLQSGVVEDFDLNVGFPSTTLASLGAMAAAASSSSTHAITGGHHRNANANVRLGGMGGFAGSDDPDGTPIIDWGDDEPRTTTAHINALTALVSTSTADLPPSPVPNTRKTPIREALVKMLHTVNARKRGRDGYYALVKEGKAEARLTPNNSMSLTEQLLAASTRFKVPQKDNATGGGAASSRSGSSLEPVNPDDVPLFQALVGGGAAVGGGGDVLLSAAAVRSPFEEDDDHPSDAPAAPTATTSTVVSNGKTRWMPKRADSAPWTEDDTQTFYDALQQYGTDFTVISVLFQNRTRKDIFAKFRKEFRLNPRLIEVALKAENQKPIDLEKLLARKHEKARLLFMQDRRQLTAEEMQLLNSDLGGDAATGTAASGGMGASPVKEEGIHQNNKPGKRKFGVAAAASAASAAPTGMSRSTLAGGDEDLPIMDWLSAAMNDNNNSSNNNDFGDDDQNDEDMPIWQQLQKEQGILRVARAPPAVAAPPATLTTKAAAATVREKVTTTITAASSGPRTTEAGLSLLDDEDATFLQLLNGTAAAKKKPPKETTARVAKEKPPAKSSKKVATPSTPVSPAPAAVSVEPTVMVTPTPVEVPTQAHMTMLDAFEDELVADINDAWDDDGGLDGDDD